MVKVGIIGLGNIGKSHLRQFRGISGVEIACVVDVREEVAKSVASEFRIDNWHSDYKKLLEMKDVDAVAITTPPYLHAEMVIEAAKEGKDIYCEKPMALTLHDADEMVKACKKSGVKFFINYTPRWGPAFIRLKEILDSDEFGAPIWIRTQDFFPVIPGIWIPPSWFWKKELGGGQLIENSCHIVDYVRLLAGDVETVTAQATVARFRKAWPPYFDVSPNIEDVGVIILHHKKGCLSNISNGCIIPAEGGCRCTVEVATASHFLDLEAPYSYWVGSLSAFDERQRLFKLDFDETSVVQSSEQYFVQCIKDDVKPTPDEMDGRAVLEITLAALKSSEEHKTVSLPLKE